MCSQETQRLMQEPVPGISAVPDDNNARYFHVIVAGPEGSPFEVRSATFIYFTISDLQSRELTRGSPELVQPFRL